MQARSARDGRGAGVVARQEGAGRCDLLVWGTGRRCWDEAEEGGGGGVERGLWVW